ncbi:MAG TPA: hypothetical protein VE870_16220, partial [Bacteroidales bacterium]|nr:hypothetical protein [Bacteroidales bacterium]
MKKLLTVAFGMLFVASFAFAQNTADLTQTGDSNDGAIGQVGSGNTGDILQNATFGDGNFADIDQTGDN